MLLENFKEVSDNNIIFHILIKQAQQEERFLVAEVKKGNTGAFEVLYRRYHVRLFHFALRSLKNREDASGMVQTVFMRLWEKRALLDESQVFGAFVFRIARNMIYNEIRKKIRDTALVDRDNKSLDGFAEETFDRIDFEDLERCLQASLEKLPERRRQIFELSRKRGLTYREISQELGISENTVDTQMRKALQFLRENLSNQYYIFLLTSLFLY